MTMKMLATMALLWPAAVTAQAVPSIAPFAQQTPPPAPDYRRPQNWAARAGAEGEAARVPAGATPAARHPRADIFYIHPTTDVRRDRWNADVTDQPLDHWTDISAVARQASIFNACCRVFAPRYRQATAAAFSASGRDGNDAYDRAYRDVERAFDRYLAHDNHGRPFILAGHSQGALLAKRLLRERIEGTPVAGRLVAAYIVGIGIAQGEFGRTFRAIKPCTMPDQTGCMIGWNSFLATADTEAYRQRSLGPYRAQYGDAGAELLCSDPLTLSDGGDSGADRPGGGSLPGDARDGPLQALVPGAVTARCVKGVVMVAPEASLGLKPLPGGSMHYHDLSIFYSEIRADAVRRVAAFVSRGGGRAAGG